MPGETVQIKRYPNRRFYARNTSKYVSLQEIEAMVRDGLNVEIRDSQTGEDMTHAVLTQIIVDRQPDKMALFPIGMLHAIVRSNEAMREFLRDYFRHSLMYLDYLQRHGASPREMTNPMHWVKAWLGGRETADNGSHSQIAVESEPEQVLAERVRQLEARLQELESRQTHNGKSS